MKRLKQIVAIAMLVGLVSVGNGIYTVEAEPMDEVGTVVDGSILTDQKEAKDETFAVGKGTDFYRGGSQISAVDNNTVNIYGFTFANHTCESLDVYLYLEQYKNGSWSTYGIYQYTDYNVSTMSRSRNVDVEPGYYYRVRGYHRTYNDGRQESASTMTDGIPIGR